MSIFFIFLHSSLTKYLVSKLSVPSQIISKSFIKIFLIILNTVGTTLENKEKLLISLKLIFPNKSFQMLPKMEPALVS